MHANNLQAQTPPKKAWIFDENWTKIPTKWRKRNTINLKERTDQRVNILERVSPLAIFMFTTRNWKSLAFILCASNIIVHSTERFMISIRYWKMRRAVWVNTFIVLDMSWRLSLEQHLRYGAAYSLLHSVCQREYNTTCVCILFSLLSHEYWWTNTAPDGVRTRSSLSLEIISSSFLYYLVCTLHNSLWTYFKCLIYVIRIV